LALLLSEASLSRVASAFASSAAPSSWPDHSVFFWFPLGLGWQRRTHRFDEAGRCLPDWARMSGTIRFDEGRFSVLATVDLTNEWNCVVELIHPTRDEREGDRIVRDRVRLTWTAPTYGTPARATGRHRRPGPGRSP
jgi:hypothetical protein